MKKSQKTFVVGLVILIIVVIAAYLFYTSGPQVSTNGVSTIKAQPDKISVYITLQSINPTAQAAQDSVNVISDKILAELASLGFEDKDIELANYNVYPNYDWSSGSSRITGYTASQQLNVNLADFDKTSEVIDAASKSGALVSGINYELSIAKQNEYKAQALNEASKDAKVKAESIASGFGKHLGRLVSVQSNEFNYYPYPLYTRSDMAAGNAEAVKAVSSISASPSELEVSASINAVYSMTRF